MENDTLYGLYELIFDQVDGLEITGTGDFAKCSPLVQKYLFNKGEDEYIDHIELKKIEDEIKVKRPQVNKNSK
jgi:hypothetical protein